MKVDNTQLDELLPLPRQARLLNKVSTHRSQSVYSPTRDNSGAVVIGSGASRVLSTQPQLTSELPFDSGKVKAICEALDASTYKIDSERIANGFLAHIRSLLAPES